MMMASSCNALRLDSGAYHPPKQPDKHVCGSNFNLLRNTPAFLFRGVKQKLTLQAEIKRF